MKTYTVSNKPINVFGPGFDNKRIVERKAANIDNLRKNLCADLKKRGDQFYVYDVNEYLGSIGYLGKGSEVGWPEYIWMAKGNIYRVSPTSGKITLIPQAKRRY